MVAREMAQGLRAFDALVGDPRLIPRTHMGTHNHLHLPGQLAHTWCTYTQAGKHSYTNEIN